MDFKNNFDRNWKRFLRSLGYAWNGLKFAITNEQNLKIHFFIATFVIVLSIALNIPMLEKLILLIVIGNVVSLEMINTALERVVDLVTKEYHPLAKVAKDVAAGAVLVFSIFAVMIGILIFYEPIIQLIK